MVKKKPHDDVKLHFILREQLLVNHIRYSEEYMIDWLMELVIIYQVQQITDSPLKVSL